MPEETPLPRVRITRQCQIAGVAYAVGAVVEGNPKDLAPAVGAGRAEMVPDTVELNALTVADAQAAEAKKAAAKGK